MAKPSPASSILQTVLIMAMVFLGMQLLFPPQPDHVDYFGKRIASSQIDDLKATLLDANAKLYDVTAPKVNAIYGKAIDKQVAEKKLTPEQAEAMKIESAIIVADTQLKAGLARNDTGRIRTAYHSLLNYQNRLEGKPQWNQTVAVTDTTSDPRFGWKEWTGESIYGKAVETISERGKHDKVWGVIPGGYQFIDWLVRLTGSVPSFSYAFAAFILALIVRSMVWPLAQKQLMFGRQMMQLTPLINDIKKQYGDDPATMQRKTMELYGEYGINPAAGCLPAIVQIPLFLTVYQAMLLYEFEFQKGTFLWVNPATSQALPAGLVAPNLGRLDPALIVIYGVMMIVSTLLTPVSDPAQVKQQRIMGIGISLFFTVTMFFGWFPVPGAFVLYWIFLLVLSTLQALRAYRLPIAPLQKKVHSANGGAIPATGFGGKWANRLQEMMAEAEKQQPSKNGKGTIVGTGEYKTGAPAKHKPKKRK